MLESPYNLGGRPPMKPANLDIVIYQGATWRLPMQWIAVDTPVNLNGYGLQAQARLTFNSNDQRLLFDLSVGDGITITDSDEGKFELLLSHEATDAMDFVRASWELEAIQPNGDVLRIAQGYVTLSRGIEP